VVEDVREDHDIRALAVVVREKVGLAKRDHVRDPRLFGEPARLGNGLRAFEDDRLEAGMRSA
jgi:hypothetical protein